MLRPLLAALVLLGGLSACSSDAASDPGDRDGPAEVVVGYYPLQFVVERVGGPAVRLTSLAAPGAEPHDLELTPKQVAAVREADLVVFSAGFQPAVDDAVAEVAEDRRFDTSQVVELQDGFVPIEEGELAEDERGRDPHFWLDPRLLRTVADRVAARLAEAVPSQAEAVRQRAEQLGAELDALHTELRTGLGDCARRELVTSHNAFGYLARAYGLEQVGITGLTPEEEPTPRRLAQVAEYARGKRVTTVFFEELVSPRVAEQLAREVGARAAVLSPLESAPEQGDYTSAMRANLAALRSALDCS